MGMVNAFLSSSGMPVVLCDDFRKNLPLCMSMARKTQSDQIVFGIRTRVTAKPLVMDFRVLLRTAELASPVVPPQDLLT
jgi:hypothetical protein